MLPVFDKLDGLKKFLVYIIANFPVENPAHYIVNNEYPKSIKEVTKVNRIKIPKINAIVP